MMKSTIETANNWLLLLVTQLHGANLTGNRFDLDVGKAYRGNLNIESLQDTSQYSESSKSSGFSVSVPITGSSFGASVSAGKTNINSNYASVGEQSGIKAGDGGFNVTVAGNTALTGAVITSTQKAADEGKNSFESGGNVILTDIQNTASYRASGSSATIGVGSSLGSSSAGAGAAAGGTAGAAAAGNEVVNNWLRHTEVAQMIQSINTCKQTTGCNTSDVIAAYVKQSASRSGLALTDEELAADVKRGEAMLQAYMSDPANGFAINGRLPTLLAIDKDQFARASEVGSIGPTKTDQFEQSFARAYYGPVAAATSAALPATPLVGALAGGSFSIVGQYKDSGTVRPSEVLIDMTMGGLSASLGARTGFWGNTGLGGVAGYVGTEAKNQYYGENKDSINSALWGAGFGGAGYTAGAKATLYIQQPMKQIPALLNPYTSLPKFGGATTGSIIGGFSTLITPQDRQK